MRYCITFNLRIYQRNGKRVFRWKKLNFEHIGSFVHTAECLVLGKAPNIYNNYLMFQPSRDNIWNKALQVQKFTFNNDSMMSSELIILVCSEITLGVYLSVGGWPYLIEGYCRQVVEMNFSSINLISYWKLFLFLPAELYIMKMHCSCITIQGYSSQSRKFEKTL